MPDRSSDLGSERACKRWCEVDVKSVLRITAILIATIVSVSRGSFAQTGTSSVQYFTPDRGGMVLETAGGTNNPPIVGYARVQPSASTTPSALAVFDLRQNGVLVAEAAVPGTTGITSGRIYAEVNGPINTGVAFANPNDTAVTISFNFTDQNGNDFGQGSFVLAAGAQTAKFLSEVPYRAAGFSGTFTFNTSAPVGVVSLRTSVNERGEVFVVTQTVTPFPATLVTGTIVVGHFANGGGWTTEVILVNTSDAGISGTVQFLNEGTAAVPGTPIVLNVNGQVASSFTYSIRPRSSAKLDTAAPAGATTQVGSIVVVPDAGSIAPATSAVFSFSKNGVTVTRAAIQTQLPGVAFRSYVEENSSGAVPGAVQSGIAISNNSAASATVNFELTALDGSNTGMTASVFVPASGHVSKFVHELFPGLSLPFRGILRVSSASSIVMVALRLRYNERGDFTITTIPATNEASPSSTAELIFPQIADQGGYSTQFIFFSGVTGQRTTGMLRFFSQTGQPVNVTLH
jgi:hypothetical protein